LLSGRSALPSHPFGLSYFKYTEIQSLKQCCEQVSTLSKESHSVIQEWTFPHVTGGSSLLEHLPQLIFFPFVPISTAELRYSSNELPRSGFQSDSSIFHRYHNALLWFLCISLVCRKWNRPFHFGPTLTARGTSLIVDRTIV
jgi:hypothetical protein